MLPSRVAGCDFRRCRLYLDACCPASCHATAAHQPWGEALAFLRTSCKQLRVPNALVITGRALRAGGATDWFAADAHSLWVKAQGGWASDAYLVYNRPSPRQRAVMGRVYTKVVFSRQAAHSVSDVTA